MQKVMRQIVANVAKYTTTVHCNSSIPIIEENGMSKFPEWSRDDYEHGWWHDEAIFVHGKVMVNAMEKEMECNADTVIREVFIEMEETSVKAILYNSPDAKP